eukprot:gene7955-7360_t
MTASPQAAGHGVCTARWCECKVQAVSPETLPVGTDDGHAVGNLTEVAQEPGGGPTSEAE